MLTMDKGLHSISILYKQKKLPKKQQDKIQHKTDCNNIQLSRNIKGQLENIKQSAGKILQPYASVKHN